MADPRVAMRSCELKGRREEQTRRGEVTEERGRGRGRAVVLVTTLTTKTGTAAGIEPETTTGLGSYGVLLLQVSPYDKCRRGLRENFQMKRGTLFQFFF